MMKRKMISTTKTIQKQAAAACKTESARKRTNQKEKRVPKDSSNDEGGFIGSKSIKPEVKAETEQWR